MEMGIPPETIRERLDRADHFGSEILLVHCGDHELVDGLAFGSSKLAQKLAMVEEVGPEASRYG